MRAWNPSPGFVPPITIEDIRTKRSVDDFIAFVRRLYYKIQNGKNWDIRCWSRLRADPVAKVFVEELVPLWLMFNHEKNIARHMLVSIPCDNGADDALLLAYRSDGTDQQIQITTDWGPDEARTDVMLTATGYAPARRPMMGYSFTAEKVLESIQKKENKAYAEGTWLIVEMFDSTSGDRNTLREFVCEKIRKACLHSRFERVYLVSPNDHGFCQQVR